MPTLKEILDQAFDEKDAKNSCSHFVWHAIQGFKPDQPYLTANALVKLLAHSPTDWEEIKQTESQKMADLANKGALIVGGRETDPNGHVIVVYPGNLIESGGYAYSYKGKTTIMNSHGTYARAMSRSLGSWPGAKSEGDKTIWDPWAGPNFAKVKFWVYIPSKPKE